MAGSVGREKVLQTINFVISSMTCHVLKGVGM